MQTQTLQRKDSAAQCETRSFALKIKSVGEDGTIEGYGSVFGVEDSYGDVVAKGAFKSSLAEHKSEDTMPAMLWQHDPSEPIGVWTSMSEDTNGLAVKGQLALDTDLGKRAHALLKLGALNGLSIGFMTKKFQRDNKTNVRTLTEIDLWEVSLVTFPANGKARVTSVKSLADAGQIDAPKDAERILREAGFSRDDATVLVSRIMQLKTKQSESADLGAAQKAADRLLETLKSTPA